MDAALRGAKGGGGETIAILPCKSDASTFADIAIVTGMNNARNNINVLTSDAVVALSPSHVHVAESAPQAVAAVEKLIG